MWSIGPLKQHHTGIVLPEILDNLLLYCIMLMPTTYLYGYFLNNLLLDIFSLILHSSRILDGYIYKQTCYYKYQYILATPAALEIKSNDSHNPQIFPPVLCIELMLIIP